MLTIGSTFLAVTGLVSMWLISRGKPLGWLVSIAVQFAWVPYDITTAQYGFLLITAVSVPVSAQGWRAFRRGDTRKPQPHAGDDVTASQ